MLLHSGVALEEICHGRRGGRLAHAHAPRLKALLLVLLRQPHQQHLHVRPASSKNWLALAACRAGLQPAVHDLEPSHAGGR